MYLVGILLWNKQIKPKNSKIKYKKPQTKTITITIIIAIVIEIYYLYYMCKGKIYTILRYPPLQIYL